jgi:hypothetical protein
LLVEVQPRECDVAGVKRPSSLRGVSKALAVAVAPCAARRTLVGWRRR